MITADWCKTVCPQLAAFNKAFIARQGRGLVPHILLIGSDDEIAFCVEQEAKLFHEKELMINETPCRDPKDMTSPQTMFLNSDKDITVIPGNLYFYKHCDATIKNVFVVKGIRRNNQMEQLVKMLAFDGLTVQQLMQELKKYEKIGKMPTETFVNNTLVSHYEKYDDNIFHSDDLCWLRKRTATPATPATPTTPNTPKTPASPVIPKTPVAPTTPEIPEAVETVPVEREAKPEPEKPSENAKDVPPAPEFKEKKVVVSGNVKESLTDEESAHNEELLRTIESDYQKVIDLIDSTKNAKWRSIHNKMKDAVKKNKYTQQWCPLYLEISDNVSTELYAMLYDLDKKTLDFQQSLVHHVVTLGCPSCGKNWDEDITFTPKGVHYVFCPHCYQERGFEKE